MSEFAVGLFEEAGLSYSRVITALPLIVEDIRRTAEYSGDIAEIVINMSTESAVAKAEDRLMKTAQSQR